MEKFKVSDPVRQSLKGLKYYNEVGIITSIIDNNEPYGAFVKFKDGKELIFKLSSLVKA